MPFPEFKGTRGFIITSPEKGNAGVTDVTDAPGLEKRPDVVAWFKVQRKLMP